MTLAERKGATIETLHLLNALAHHAANVATGNKTNRNRNFLQQAKFLYSFP